MTFLVILLALLAERFLNWSHLRGWQWFSSYENRVTALVSKRISAPWLNWLAVILPLLLVTLIMQASLKHLLFGLLALIFQLAVLIYCLGPNNFWADRSLKEEGNGALNSLFINANERVFAVIFWYGLLGPFGALLYRLTALSQAAPARTLRGWLNRPPIQVMTFFFALAGKFTDVFGLWRKLARVSVAENDLLLTSCGQAAIEGSGAAEVINMQQAFSLLDRVFIIVLVVAAVCSLIL